MKSYFPKRFWKWLLFFFGAVIVIGSLWFTNRLVQRIAAEERQKVKLWADAIQRKASLVTYTEQLFDKLQVQERKRVEIWAEANRKLITADPNEDLTFFLKIISDNTTIPVVVTDDKGLITNATNVDFNTDEVHYFTDDIKREFSGYPAMIVKYYGNLKIHLYYKDSKIFSDLRRVMDDLIRSFISEVVINSASSPVIITDSTKNHVIAYGNIPNFDTSNQVTVKKIIHEMRYQNPPIVVELANQGINYIFYRDSYLLQSIRYYPIIQFAILGFFLFMAYFLFSTARNSEQNQVWMGMARETAHQLGTPISSLMAWLEVLKLRNADDELVVELNKDIVRLETITERFSKIGSPPQLDVHDVEDVLEQILVYLKPRTSKNVNYIINPPNEVSVKALLNKVLFEWVIENICKNAVDSMSGKGSITIDIINDQKFVFIDITDTGKGIPKSRWRSIFRPGYSTKKKGWGLGLSLAERIIKQMHNGKIVVRKSVIDKGTTFRVGLKKAL